MLKFFPLAWAGLWRRPARTIFTALSVLMAFVLFAILAGINSGFTHVVEIARMDRLYTVARFGGKPMPLAYADQIAKIPGVTMVAPRTGVDCYFQDPKNSLHIIMADERYFAMKPEIVASKQQVDMLMRNRTGAIISVFTAKKYGWKVGDTVPLISNIPTRDGSRVWTFKILSIVDDSERPGQARYFVGNYQYLDERRLTEKGTIDLFIVRISDTNLVTQVGRAIDGLFSSSGAPTKTGSEKSYYQSDIRQLGDVQLFTNSIVAAVLFMVLFLTGNSMGQAFYERTSEFAVLKTLGFSDNQVLLLILSEALLLCVLSALGGLALARLSVPLIRALDPDFLGQMLQMRWVTLASGLAAAAVVAFASGIVPAVRGRRLSIVSALKR